MGGSSVGGRLEPGVAQTSDAAGEHDDALAIFDQVRELFACLGVPRDRAESFDRARDFLQREMDAGRLRPSDPSMLLLSIYSTVVGVATELEVQRAMGMAPTLRAAVVRRQELLRFLRAALAPAGS